MTQDLTQKYTSQRIHLDEAARKACREVLDSQDDTSWTGFGPAFREAYQ